MERVRKRRGRTVVRRKRKGRKKREMRRMAIRLSKGRRGRDEEAWELWRMLVDGSLRSGLSMHKIIRDESMRLGVVGSKEI